MLCFNDLCWHKLNLTLLNVRLSSTREHPFAIFQSVIKNITNRFNRYEDCRIVFHVQENNFSHRLKKNGLYNIEVLFFRHNDDFILQWIDEAKEYFKNPLKRNFSLENISPIQNRDYETLLKEKGEAPDNDEVCLDFLSPLSFTPPDKKRRFFLSEKGFVDSFRRRLTTLFGEDVNIPTTDDIDFKILPYYWKFEYVTHPSKTTPNTKLMIRGCVGKLYIKGDLKNIWPLLVLGSEIHAGGKLSYSHGYYKLLKKSPAFFTPALKNKEYFISFGNTILSESDKLFENDLSKSGLSTGAEAPSGSGSQPHEILTSIWEQLNNGTYRFSPNQAFFIKNRNGGDRLIENLSLEDFVVQRFILKIIHGPMDNIFEDSSLGYRKGKSVDLVFAKIEALLDEGYHYIFESDVEDFFPSIDFQKLEELLIFYFPEQDILVRNLIIDAFHQGYILNNRIKKRTKGLALGSPLSPDLTNLYLDSFDERFLGDDSVLLRYSDDFVIMAKTKEAVEMAALRSQMALAELGLKPKETKTRIVHYKDGFNFLGRFFSSGRTLQDAAKRREQ